MLWTTWFWASWKRYPHTRCLSGRRTENLTELKASLIAAVKPDLTDLEAQNRLQKAHELEHPEAYDDVLIEPEVLADVLDKGDAVKVHQFTMRGAMAQAKKTRNHTRGDTYHVKQ